MPVERSNHRGHNAYTSSLPYQRAQLGMSSMVGPQMQPAAGGQSSWMGTMGTMQMAASQMHPGHYPRQQQVYSKDGYFSQHAGMFMGTSQVAQAGPANMPTNNLAPNHPPSNDGDTILLYQPYKPPTQVPSVERPEFAFMNNALQLDLGPVAGTMGGTPQYIHSGYSSSSSTPLSNGSQRSVPERTRRADGPHRPPVFMPASTTALQVGQMQVRDSNLPARPTQVIDNEGSLYPSDTYLKAPCCRVVVKSRPDIPGIVKVKLCCQNIPLSEDAMNVHAREHIDELFVGKSNKNRVYCPWFGCDKELQKGSLKAHIVDVHCKKIMCA